MDVVDSLFQQYTYTVLKAETEQSNQAFSIPCHCTYSTYHSAEDIVQVA